MSLFPVKYKRDSINGLPYDFRQKSAVLWRDALETSQAIDFENGGRRFTDLWDATTGVVGTGNWLATAIGTVTGPTWLVVAKEFGVARLTATATTTGEGLQVTWGAPGGVVSKADNRVIFETSLDLVNSPGFFAGLINGTTGAELALASVSGIRNATISHIGFYRNSTASVLGDLRFTTQLGAGAPSDVLVLTADQMAALFVLSPKINLGLSINSHNKVDIVVNGERIRPASDQILASALPAITGFLQPVLASTDFLTSGGTTTVTLDVDWLEVHQSAN